MVHWISYEKSFVEKEPGKNEKKIQLLLINSDIFSSSFSSLIRPDFGFIEDTFKIFKHLNLGWIHTWLQFTLGPFFGFVLK